MDCPIKDRRIQVDQVDALAVGSALAQVGSDIQVPVRVLSTEVCFLLYCT